MEIRELAYQQRVLKQLDQYLDILVEQKSIADKREQANAKITDPALKHEPWNFPEQTWEALKNKKLLPTSRVNTPYSPRESGTKTPVPNIVYKVPTAGGKTLLAVSSLSKIFTTYLNKSTGFVLWIVPSQAIYVQTERQLNDRRHPYRQLLDNLSGNKVKIMDKTTPLHSADIENNLCVMLLMLQSSNRENKETLKIFQERGDVHGFTPAQDDQKAHQLAKEAIPNLDMYKLTDSVFPWVPVKDSLGNALRIINPVVVLDEGHKAISELAFETLYGFNPSFVLELTATPKDIKERRGAKPQPARYQNILVEVSGSELYREDMIKMPINLDSRQNPDWRNTLSVSLERLNELASKANTLYSNQNRYIRPIMLVQVERTGSDQRDGNHVHAEDVKEWLMNTGGLVEAEIAIKTSSQNDLKNPENIDLLDQANRVRVIITKQALQEGWDCPFAYVLCSLAVSSNQAAMTQLIGRILRQPGARKTGIKALDQCYVVTHHTETNRVVEAIKDGLEKGGMGDLTLEFSLDIKGDDTVKRTIHRSKNIGNQRIFLPKVLRVTGKQKRDLDYEMDILCNLDWSKLDVSELVQKIPDNYEAAERQMRQIYLSDSSNGQPIQDKHITSSTEDNRYDRAYAARFISDIVPNSWLAYEIVNNVVAGLEKRSFSSEKIGQFSSLINEELRKWLYVERDQKAEKRFRDDVGSGDIEFHLYTNKDVKYNWEMPLEIYAGQPKNKRRPKVGSFQKSLFDPIYEDDMNNDERDVAFYIDDQSTIKWWHRNISRKHYSLQGWRRDRIYPDFICSVQTDQTGKTKLVVLEMKGEHLAGNDDTEYKKALLQLMTQSYTVDQAQSVGEMELELPDAPNVHCELVLFKDQDTELPKILK